MFLTKIISIVIAVIVAAVVLVPICNSIVDGGNNNGEGSGSEPTIVNDLADVYSQIGVILPSDYHSMQTYHYFQDYGMEIQETSDYVMTKQDLLDIYNSDAHVNEDSSGECIIFQAKTSSAGNFYMTAVPTDISTHPTWHAESGAATEWQNIENIAEFELDFSNGHLHMISIGDSPVVIDTTVEYAKTISREMTGYIDTGLMSPENLVTISEGVGFGGFASLGYTKNGTNFNARDVEFNETDTVISENKVQLIDIPDSVSDLRSANVYISGENQKYHIDSEFVIENADSSLTNVEGGYYLNYVTTTSSIDDGSSSDNGDLGTSGTLIKVIPIFVILAILMGAVGLFYQNRNGL